MTDSELELVEELRRLAKAAFLQRNFTRKHGPLIDEAFVLLDQRPDLVAWRARFLVERSNYLRTAPHVDKAAAIPPAVEALDLASRQTDPVLFALAVRQYTMAVRSKETQADRLVLLFDALHRLEQAIETGYSKVYDLGPLTVAAQVAFRISSILKDQRRLREALEVTVRARSLPGLLDASPYWYAELMRRQSTLLRGLGLLEEHERFLDELDMLGPEVDDNTRFLRHRLRADEHERRQELAKAAARYRVALDELPPDKFPVKRGNVANTLAFVSLRLSDLPAVEAALELADRAWLEYGRATTGLAVTRRHRSRIAALEGDWQAAVEQLLESVRILREAKSERYGSTLTRLIETLAEAVDANYDVRTFESAALATPSGPVSLGDLSVLLAETERVTDPGEQGLASRAQRAAAVLTMAGFLTGHEALRHALAAYEAATKASSNGLRHRALSAGTVARVLESQGVDAMAWSRIAVEHLEQMRAQIDDEFDRARVANESRDIYLRAWRQAANAGDAAFAVRIAESARGTIDLREVS
ncbi:MAG: hypothetical protein KDB16_11025, partial [Acidimicrobiales bacterium]|nr:hypothetical protein [Acidimicrobiales bacterium]